MAIIECKSCGRKVSEFAPTCPKCGEDPQGRERTAEQPGRMRRWIFLVVVALVVVLILLGVGGTLYLKSDRHEYLVAARHVSSGNCQEAMRTTGKMSERALSSSRVRELMSQCAFREGSQAFSLGEYARAIALLETVSPTSSVYPNTLELLEEARAKIGTREQEQQRHSVDREAETQQAEETKRARGQREEEERLYGAALKAEIGYSKGQFHISNLNTYPWSAVRVTILPKGVPAGDGYTAELARINSADSQLIDTAAFSNRSGTLLTPTDVRTIKIEIRAQKPNGWTGTATYEARWQGQ